MNGCAKHPLEPLTANEVQRVVDLLKDAGKVTPTTRFVSASLQKPPKELVHAFTGRESVPRKAFVVLFDNAKNACYETVLSIDAGEVESWKHIPRLCPKPQEQLCIATSRHQLGKLTRYDSETTGTSKGINGQFFEHRYFFFEFPKILYTSIMASLIIAFGLYTSAACFIFSVSCGSRRRPTVLTTIVLLPCAEVVSRNTAP